MFDASKGANRKAVGRFEGELFHLLIDMYIIKIMFWYKAEAVTMQRMLSAQHCRPNHDTQFGAVESSAANPFQLPALNLEVSAASQR